MTTSPATRKYPYRFRPVFDSQGRRLKRRGGRRWTLLRAQIEKRDLGLVCPGTCGRLLSTVEYVVADHVVPCYLDIDGLEYEAGDLQGMCKVCNNQKGEKRLSRTEETVLLLEIEKRNAEAGIPQTPASELIARWHAE